MPPLILAGIAAAGGYLAWRRIKAEMARLEAEERASKGLTTRGESLSRDPKTGRYRLPPRD